MTAIDLQYVSKLFAGPHGTVTALDDVSLQAGEGEFLAVRGPSGCGKTTLLLTVGGLLKPEAGRVSVDGTEPYRLSADRRARFRAGTIGFVFQQFHLVPYLTVLENVLAPTLALGGNAADSRARAEELVAHMGLRERADHLPAALSTGERQRVALARALMNRPRIVLADEPTGNLDEQNRDIVLQQLREFADQGATVLLVTHDRRVSSRADKTVLLVNGAVQECQEGQADELNNY